MSRRRACHCCGLIHEVGALNAGQFAACTRCGTTIATCLSGQQSLARTAAAALGALILFFPAILLPILEVERLGHHHHSSILFGTFELISHGDWFVGIVVLVFSVVFPFLKIIMLLELSLLGILHRRHKAWTYRVMEFAGKWSMMDVMLLAFLVMLVKLGDLVRFSFGPAVFAFTLCVAMSMIASMSFDPHAIWQEDESE